MAGRWITGSSTQALREGYHTALMKGRYPVVYLFIEMDPAAVDVNVHPAKREVRFREAGMVREAVVTAVRRTLEAGRAEWARSFHQPPLPEARAPAVPARPEPGDAAEVGKDAGETFALPPRLRDGRHPVATICPSLFPAASGRGGGGEPREC